MVAADHQADAGEMSRPAARPAGVDVAEDVVDADERHVEGQGQHLGRRNADQERPHQARGVVDRHAGDLVETDAGPPQRLVDDRQQSLQVGSGGHLRHDATEAGVQIGLRRDDIGENGRLRR